MPAISTVIIAKNEEKHIATAIGSARPFSSQIVVVDTGSTDNTGNICLQAGADVYFKKWNNDFSETRNFGLAHAGGDWILSLDADEAIDYGSLLPHLDLLDNPKTGGLNVKLINYLDDDLKNYSTHRYTRIFRNDRRIRFTQSIHEQIRPSIEELGLEIIDTEIKIYHYGYINTSAAKKERNRQLLEHELQKNPDDPWMKYHLAETMFAASKIQEAAPLFTEVINSGVLAPEQKDISLIRLGQIALKQNDFQRVIQLLSFTAQSADWDGLRLYVVATAYLSLHNYKTALKYFNKADESQSPLINQAHLREAILTLENLKL